MIDLQVLKSPGPEVQRLSVELQRVFDETVLALEMLRREKRTLSPDHGLQSPHIPYDIRCGQRHTAGPASTSFARARLAREKVSYVKARSDNAIERL